MKIVDLLQQKTLITAVMVQIGIIVISTDGNINVKRIGGANAYSNNSILYFTNIHLQNKQSLLFKIIAMKKIFYILSFIPVLVLAQSQDQNYVKTTTYKVPTTVVTSPTDTQKTQNVTYYDGLGRPIQQVAYKQSDTGKDIVTPIEYDSLGRQAKEYLPYVPTTAASQDYKASALTDISNFPDYLNQNPFSDKQLEKSPLNRVLKQAAPGNLRQLGKRVRTRNKI